MFTEKYKKETDAVETSYGFEQKLIENAKKSAVKEKFSERLAAFFSKNALKVAAVAACFALIAAAVIPAVVRSQYGNNFTVVNAEDYASVYKAVTANKNIRYPYYLYKNSDGSIRGNAAWPATELDTVYAPTDSAPDHSETNVQVAGVDEGDVVKTDGKYIYHFSKGGAYLYDGDGTESETPKSVVRIIKPEGKKTTVVSTITLEDVYNAEIYIYGDVLAVCRNVFTPLEKEENGDGPYYYWYYRGSYSVAVTLYDVSDRANPVKKTEFTQSGNLNTTRLKDGVLYVVSNYWLYNEADENDPATFVPNFSKDGEVSVPEVGNIFVCEETPVYTVIGGYSLDKGEMQSDISILGSADVVYCSLENFYICFYDYESTRYSYKEHTNIVKIAIKDRMLEKKAEASVEGTLLNQFSLDEYKGKLRLVTTVDSYNMLADARHNDLVIFDERLIEIGSVRGLAENERVYSVRFDGDTAYFVTFRQVDPLFAVDLSDTTAPMVMSALKIPGFSEYLHVWKDGLLFGLGKNADEITGRAGDMKLSMFDTSNPYDVTEKSKITLDGVSYSEASYNHKAILIDPAKNLIGFAVWKYNEEGGDYRYYIFSYDAERGFKQINDVPLDESWYSAEARGVYIGNCFYILTDGCVAVIDLYEDGEPAVNSFE